MELDLLDGDLDRFLSFGPEVKEDDKPDHHDDSGPDEYLFPPGFQILLFFHFSIPYDPIFHVPFAYIILHYGRKGKKFCDCERSGELLI